MHGNQPLKRAEDDKEPRIDAIYSNIKLGKTPIVKRLLSGTDIDINHRDKDGRTPLSWAASDGGYEMVE